MKCIKYKYSNINRRRSGDSVVKNPPANAGDPGLGLDSIPGLGRSPKKGMATHSSVLTWKIPWTEEPGGPQSVGLQKSQT